MSKRLRSSEVCADCSGPGESHQPGPLPSALLAGTPVPGPPPRAGRVPAVELCTLCLGSGRGGTSAALGRDRPGPVRAGAGRGSPPSRPFLPSRPLCPRPGGETAGSGPLSQQEGAWAIRRKASYRSEMRASSRLRPPEAAGVSPLPTATQTPAPGGGPGALPGVGDTRRFPPLGLARGPPWMSSPLLTSLLPLHRGESPGCRGLANDPST